VKRSRRVLQPREAQHRGWRNCRTASARAVPCRRPSTGASRACRARSSAERSSADVRARRCRCSAGGVPGGIPRAALLRPTTLSQPLAPAPRRSESPVDRSGCGAFGEHRASRCAIAGCAFRRRSGRAFLDAGARRGSEILPSVRLTATRIPVGPGFVKQERSPRFVPWRAPRQRSIARVVRSSNRRRRTGFAQCQAIRDRVRGRAAVERLRPLLDQLSVDRPRRACLASIGGIQPRHYCLR